MDDGRLSASLIHLNDGVGSSGSIVINDVSGGIAPVGANGDIQVRPDITFGPYPSVTYPGCIKIVDNLNGDIDVKGCHPDSTLDLRICVQGTFKGSINVNACACPYPIGGVNAGCLATCP